MGPEPSLKRLHSAERDVFLFFVDPELAFGEGVKWTRWRLSSIYIYMYMPGTHSCAYIWPPNPFPPTFRPKKNSFFLFLQNFGKIGSFDLGKFRKHEDIINITSVLSPFDSHKGNVNDFGPHTRKWRSYQGACAYLAHLEGFLGFLLIATRNAFMCSKLL